MQISVIGTGYVGLVAGTCLAETGNQVICVDKDEEKIKKLKKNKPSIYEPGLEGLVMRNQKEGRLTFTTDIKKAVSKSKMIFLAVGTPPKDDGSVDLSAVYQVAKEIGDAMEGEYKIIINKSTVPVGTAKRVKEIIQERTKAPFDVVSNPEFLKEGNALEDFLKPDRIIIGTNNPRVAELMKELYAPFVRTGNPVLIIGIESAEMAKYASNTLLATKISFINEIAKLCEKVGADIEEVRRGVGTDPRIGFQFIFPGVGYGGSCFPKDIKALAQTGRDYNLEMHIAKAVDRVNEEQKRVLFEKIKSHFGSLKSKRIAIWGLSFKPRTDDMREAPSIVIINNLLKEGTSIIAYDPEAMDNAKRIFAEKIDYGETPYQCLQNADALAIITEWNEFRNPDFEKIGSLLREKVIFDGRNLYNPGHLMELGFKYYSIGRS
ncbi:UDP-glucose/GDP-mannose dehydrogenase family protein [candidate division WOR-3 bacterium]|nr:UDP-glucose/GDP-mannose dehydrogenase family protein [candidate division WOR-3 bacterium]